jgi:hypothetical protein
METEKGLKMCEKCNNTMNEDEVPAKMKWMYRAFIASPILLFFHPIIHFILAVFGVPCPF